jgi:O-antigen ligase
MDHDQVKTEPFGLGRSILQNCVIALICLSIVAPPIPSGGTFPFLRVEEVLIPILFLLYIWLLMVGLVPTFRFNGMFLIGVVFTFCILLSIWYGAVVLEQNVVVRDFYEIPKLWFPVIFFTMAYETKFSQRGLRRLFFAYGVAVLLVCLYAWAQWIGLPVTQTLNSYYSGGVHDESLYLTKRVYSTMGNPNVLGLLLSWGVIGFTLALAAKIGNRLLSGLILLSCAITIAMTASRSALLSAATGIAILLVLGFSNSPVARKRGIQIGMLFLFSTVALIAYQVVQTNPHAVSRYQELKHPGQVDSLRERLDDLWLDALTDFARSPLLGFGPAKVRFGGIVTDSEYLDVLKQFGLLGFAAYFCFFLYPLFILWKAVRLSNKVPPSLEPELRADILVVRFTFIMMILALLINIGAATFYSLFLQGFLWLWFGVGAGSASTICHAAGIISLQKYEYSGAETFHSTRISMS